ncbi:MAG: hypothetical protein GY805_06580, partial [Chloroflexi bacterium]|nr:hypothetical protein [Chloroflexota bacterium]
MINQQRGCSPAILAAQQRLFALREQHKASRQDLPLVPEGSNHPPATYREVVAVLPAHVGWGSAVTTAVLRRHQQKSSCAGAENNWLADLPKTAVVNPVSHSSAPDNLRSTTHKSLPGSDQLLKSPGWIKLYPDIGLGILRQEMAAPGRLWLMLRYLDQQGCGVLRIDIIKQTLTHKLSNLRICGKRQLRNLIRDGEGVFWQRDKARIWLRSAAKVAHALGVTRLTGQPVGLPVSVLTGGIGEVRAHLYASFHSGRVKASARANSDVWSPPIARDTLTAVSGVGRVTQRSYEKCSRTKVQFNFAVGETAEEANRQRRAWKQGQALFELKDYRGQQGQVGKIYLAWQLPNTYVGRHQQRPKGRQKRINRELNDLVMKGMPGTVEEACEPSELILRKRYYPNGKLAAKAYGRKPEHELYWKRHRSGNGRFDVWQELV